MPESSGGAANHPWRIFARVFSAADGAEDCPTDVEVEDSERVTRPRTFNSNASSDASLQPYRRSLQPIRPTQPLRDSDRKAMDLVGEDFKRMGLPDWVTQRVEDLVIDHFYRIQSDLFHVEHELKACMQEAQSQQHESQAMAKRIFNLETELKALRPGTAEPAGLHNQLLANDVPINECAVDRDSSIASVSTAASTAFTAASAATLATHDELLQQLRRDFDAHAKFHEARLAAVQHSLNQCCGVLQAFGGELTTAPPSWQLPEAEGKDPQLLEQSARHASVQSGLQSKLQTCSSNGGSTLQQISQRPVADAGRELNPIVLGCSGRELNPIVLGSTPATMPAASKN